MMKRRIKGRRKLSFLREEAEKQQEQKQEKERVLTKAG